MKKIALVLSLLTLTTGCNKIRELAGGSGDGGASGGGLLGSLFGTDFEGEITMQAKSRQAGKSGPTTMVIGIKKPKYRVDASGGSITADPRMAQGASLILDPPAKKGYALVPAEKKAMVLDFEKMKGMSQGLPKGMGGTGTPSAAKNPGTIEKTGKKEVIAGYECEIWKITSSDGRKADVCAAEGITWFDLGELGWSSPEIAIAGALTGVNRFPLRVVGYDAKGVEEVRVEATKIDKKPLPETQFQVPPDYQIIDLAAMLGNMPTIPPGAGTGLPPNFKLPQPPPKR